MRSKRLKQKMEVPKGKPKEEKANSERRSEEDISKDEKEIAHFRDVYFCFLFKLDTILIPGLYTLYEDGV